MNDGTGQIDGLPFAGEVRTFCLKNGGLFKVESECDKSAFELQVLLADQRGRTSWIKSVIVNGLVGGGTPLAEAYAIFKIHVEDKSDWIEAGLIAAIVLTAGLTGPPDEDDLDAGKTEAKTAPKNV